MLCGALAAEYLLGDFQRMTPRKRKIIVFVVAALGGIFAMGQLDFHRLQGGSKPMFARWARYPADGGSVEYPFVGYTVATAHRIERMTPMGKQYRVGPVLSYWIPFIGRDQSVLIVRTNI